jgi:nitroimidazol reductase NimA-like FMN-containing flavoprotein (pyridoxamine 5'-phosphate oxidase superfamily)
VTERLEKSRNYWVATADGAGRPHVVPVWGLWVDDILCFGGAPETRWMRNLAANPWAAVHLESGDDVVMLEGKVEEMNDPDHPLVKRCADASMAKYGMGGGVPFLVLRPQVVFAWSNFLSDATRWRFD